MAKKKRKKAATQATKTRACKPTKKLKGSERGSYNELCKVYSTLRNEYHKVGRSVMGKPDRDPRRKLYAEVKREYKKVGKALFKMGHPKGDWGKQHRR